MQYLLVPVHGIMVLITVAGRACRQTLSYYPGVLPHVAHMQGVIQWR